MIYIYKSVNLIASFIEIFLLYKVYSNLLYKYRRKENSLKNEIILGIIGTLIIIVCNNIEVFSFFTMIIFVLYTSITAMIFYRTNYVVLFSISSFYLLCLGYFDFIIFTSISRLAAGHESFIKLITEPNGWRCIIIVGIKFAWIVLYFILKKYLLKFFINWKNIHAFILTAIAGFLGFVFLVKQTFKGTNNDLAGIWLLFLLVFALSFFVIYLLSEIKSEKMKLYFSEMQNKVWKDSYESIEDIYRRNAKLYHDLNNHLNALHFMLEQKHVDEAKEYIQRIGQPILQLSKVTWTANNVIDAILNSKLDILKEMGVETKVNVEFPQSTNLQPNDMCTILGNILDNAIEALEKLEYPGNMTLVMRKINQFLVIKLSNSSINNERGFHEFITTKADKELHGWGLPSVKSVVEKYNGTIKCSNKEGEFTVMIMLFYQEEEL
ncbi:MAG TPA: sensor histidine kinase [Candidatus Merdenecus merdavium]|nr:sensor histidine kinase [Candidatus Merdenecus merdavium]